MTLTPQQLAEMEARHARDEPGFDAADDGTWEHQMHSDRGALLTDRKELEARVWNEAIEEARKAAEGVGATDWGPGTKARIVAGINALKRPEDGR